jgi:hypothetical protein
MKTPIQCLALHLGEWHGLFSDYRPTAHGGWELVGQKRSLITFEAYGVGRIRQTNAYYPLEGSPNPQAARAGFTEISRPDCAFFPSGLLF